MTVFCFDDLLLHSVVEFCDKRELMALRQCNKNMYALATNILKRRASLVSNITAAFIKAFIFDFGMLAKEEFETAPIIQQIIEYFNSLSPVLQIDTRLVKIPTKTTFKIENDCCIFGYVFQNTENNEQFSINTILTTKSNEKYDFLLRSQCKGMSGCNEITTQINTLWSNWNNDFNNLSVRGKKYCLRIAFIVWLLLTLLTLMFMLLAMGVVVVLDVASK